MRARGAVFACALVLALGNEACEGKKDDAKTASSQSALTLSTSEPPKPAPSSTESASGSGNATATSPVVDTVVGTGAEAREGTKVTVHYTGYVLKSTGELSKFESSLDKKKPYSFRVGAGAVIKGWDSGIVGMKVGGKRRLTIPPQLAYGPAGSPPSIPGNATLVFDLELLSVTP
jgi:FKBP-type peptidyl-prolyl cis-trans isomerase